MAPCSDLHYIDSDKTQELIIAEDQMHVEHMEFCSPFCFCACCKTVSYPLMQVVVKFPSPEVAFSVSTQDQWYSSFPETIWHPPKA